MPNKVQLRRGTDAERGTVVLDSGEPGWTTDTKKLYVGDGVTYGGIDIADASKTTTGTFGLARIPAVDDARIPDLDTLSYGAAFATAQIPDLAASRITSGTFGLARIPGTLTGKDADTVDGADAGVAADDIFKIPSGIAQGDVFHVNAGGSVVNLSAGTSGHFLKTLGAGTNPAWASVPGGGDMLKNVYDTGDNGIVDNTERLETNTLATVQAHNVAASRITSGTFGLARIPTMDDAHIPDVDGLSYSAAFATAQVPSIGAYKIGSGTFSSGRIPILPTDRYGSAVLLTGAQSIGGTKTFTDIPILPASNPTADNEAARKAYVDAQTAVKFHPYIGDETQLNTVSGTYQDIKNFHFVKHGSVVSPSTIRIACELKTTAGSYQMQIIVGSGTALTFSGTESAYKLRYSDYGLGAAATGVVEVRAKLRNIGAGTTYNRLYDNYLRY